MNKCYNHGKIFNLTIQIQSVQKVKIKFQIIIWLKEKIKLNCCIKIKMELDKIVVELIFFNRIKNIK